MRIRAALAALAVSAVASGCGGSAATATLDPVAEAAVATTHAGGAHMSISIRMSLGSLGGNIDISGTGFVNFATGEGELLGTLKGLEAVSHGKIGPGGMALTELYTRQRVYSTSPLLHGKLPGGASWIEIDLGSIAQQYDLEPQSLSSGESNPAQYLQYLRAYGGSLRPQGAASVRGVATKIYRGSINLREAARTLPSHDRAATEAAYARLIAQLGTDSIPVEVWLDSSHLVRRMTISMPISTAGAGTGVSIEEELFAFGATPSVNPPAAGEVYEESATALSSSGLAG